MFEPPFCPSRKCSYHQAPSQRFYHRCGYYTAKCRAHRIPRFRCLGCGRHFSRQTFRMDYRDQRPDLNAPLFLAIASGLGLRQTSRTLGLTLRCTELKFRKIARHLRQLNLNLRRGLKDGCSFQLDEFESYEGRRNTRPVSIPMLIHARSRFIVWAETASIRPRGRMTAKRRRAIKDDERRFGRRVDGSRHALERTLRRAAQLSSTAQCIGLSTDEKSSYPGLAKEAFGSERLLHYKTNSKLARGTWNPLFAINNTEAMARDLLGRLRRDSWLVSKKRRYLDLGLQFFMAYRNYVRPRFNRDANKPKKTPAEKLGFLSRGLQVGEVLGWRQVWGAISLHPLGRGKKSVAAFS